MATTADLLAGPRERDLQAQQFRAQQAQTAARQAETAARYASTGAQEAAAARQAVASKLANAAIRPSRPTPTFAPSAAGAGRGMVNPPLVRPAVTPNPNASPLAQMDPTSPAMKDPANPMKPQQGAAAAMATPPKQIAPGIYRQGNSFSDTAAGATEGARSAPISAQNMAAADALAARYQSNPVQQEQAQPGGGLYIGADTGGFGLLDKNRIAQRNAMMDVQQMKPGSGKALAALLQQQTDAPKLDLERQQMEQRGQESAQDRQMRSTELMARLGESSADRALRSQELADNSLVNAAKREAMGVETGAAKQLADLRTAYLNAKTPEEQAAAAAKINALSGKTTQDEYMAVSSGQSVDPATGLVTKSPDLIVNKRTGQPVQVGQQKAQAQAAPADATQRKAGTTYMLPNGKMGQWTPQGWMIVG